MSDRGQCPDCKLYKLKYLKVLTRWWCSFCDMEKDIEKTIKEWRENGYTPKDQKDILYGDEFCFLLDAE